MGSSGRFVPLSAISFAASATLRPQKDAASIGARLGVWFLKKLDALRFRHALRALDTLRYRHGYAF